MQGRRLKAGGSTSVLHRRSFPPRESPCLHKWVSMHTASGLHEWVSMHTYCEWVRVSCIVDHHSFVTSLVFCACGQSLMMTSGTLRTDCPPPSFESHDRAATDRELSSYPSLNAEPPSTPKFPPPHGGPRPGPTPLSTGDAPTLERRNSMTSTSPKMSGVSPRVLKVNTLILSNAVAPFSLCFFLARLALF